MMGRQSNKGGGLSRPLAVMLAGVLACVLCVGVMPMHNAMAGTVQSVEQAEGRSRKAYEKAYAAWRAAADKADKAALVTSGSVGASTAYMATTEGHTSIGYFKSRGATGAYRVLTDPQVTNSKYLKPIRVGDDRDATSFRMVRYVLKHLEEYEGIVKAGNPDFPQYSKRGESPVSDTVMAMGEVNADWHAFCETDDEARKINGCSHTREYSPSEVLLASSDTPDESPYTHLYYGENDVWKDLLSGKITVEDIGDPSNIGHNFTISGSGGDLTGAGISASPGLGQAGYDDTGHGIVLAEDTGGFAQEFEDNDGNPRNCATQTQVIGCGRIMSLKDWETDFEKYVAQTDDAVKRVKAASPKAKAALDTAETAWQGVVNARNAYAAVLYDASDGTIDDPVPDPDATVESVSPVAGVSTVQGVKPVLPDTVGVTLNDGSVDSRPVVWDAVPAASYAKPGAFTVSGRVKGWGKPVLVRVTVTAKPSQPSQPSKPSKPSTEPSQPSKPSTKPSTEPSKPSTQPSKPSTQPSDTSKPSQPSTQPSKPSASSTVVMWRLYNPNSGEHFYTGAVAERDMLVHVGWKCEGEGWTAPAQGDPVYRLYNPNAGDHHYTLNPAERDMLVKAGWKSEGVGWHSAPASDTGRKPLYRQYNPNAVAGAHNYTLSRAENDHLARIGWHAEGLAWYAA